jgi:hypothetical protein
MSAASTGPGSRMEENGKKRGGGEVLKKNQLFKGVQ